MQWHPRAIWMYSSLAFLGLLFIFFLVPETRGYRLEEVELLFNRPWGQLTAPLQQDREVQYIRVFSTKDRFACLWKVFSTKDRFACEHVWKVFNTKVRFACVWMVFSTKVRFACVWEVFSTKDRFACVWKAEHGSLQPPLSGRCVSDPRLDVSPHVGTARLAVRRDSASGYIRPDEQAKLTLVEGSVYVLQRQTIGEEAAAANANPTGFIAIPGLALRLSSHYHRLSPQLRPHQRHRLHQQTCTTGCTCTWYVEAAKGCGPSIETGHSGSVWSESAIASTPQDDSYYST
ncbi:hypothetical protein Bbelb_183070 [Branchiostoma belcheri]|nr:hypothetical protein Bbelb_183070 [Branchiostoma belcheri]